MNYQTDNTIIQDGQFVTVRNLLFTLTTIAFCVAAPLSGLAQEKTYTLTQEGIEHLNTPFTGDYDQMVKDRIIRVLIPYSKTFFFFDGAHPRGASYESVKKFEQHINKKLKTGHLQVQAFVIPTAREDLIPFIRDGKGDIAVGNLTITKERLAEVDFSDPSATGINEILVSRSDSGTFKSIFDLAGKKIHTRKSSSYYQSLLRLNETLRASHKKEVTIIEVNDSLEDEDMLEMVNASVIKYMIIDSHKGEFWTQIFDNITLHRNIILRKGGKIGWAIRKNNPKLKKVINTFIKGNKVGTLTGNILFNKYLKDTTYITNSLQNEHLQRFKIMVRYFEKYGKKYNFDYLMLAALGYQESQLNQNVKSQAGAVGVMQVLPSTAKDKNVDIANINDADSNIHAGTKYLRFMADTYFADDKDLDTLNKALFSFASYNAGPAKVARLRREAKKMGLDPNKWFNNVEIVAAKQIGRETVQYVRNIFKYYIAYTLIESKLRVKGSGPVHLEAADQKKKKKLK